MNSNDQVNQAIKNANLENVKNINYDTHRIYTENFMMNILNIDLDEKIEMMDLSEDQLKKINLLKEMSSSMRQDIYIEILN